MLLVSFSERVYVFWDCGLPLYRSNNYNVFLATDVQMFLPIHKILHFKTDFPKVIIDLLKLLPWIRPNLTWFDGSVLAQANFR